jgi:preprotein translocase subunit SecD
LVFVSWAAWAACGDGKARSVGPYVVLTYEVTPFEGQSEQQAVDQAVRGIRTRLDNRDLDRPSVVQSGRAQVRVELGARDVPVERVMELIMRSGGLGIHRVVHMDPGMNAMYRAVASEGPVGISAETESWTAPGGTSVTDVYVSSDDRAKLEAWVQAEGPRSSDLGERRVVYERVDPDPTAATGKPRWRTYLIEDAAIISGADVARVQATYDPATMRPIVVVELDADGRARFADATAAAVGAKLAIVLDGRVVSAPVVHSRIPGGRVQITMGGGDPKAQEREAHDLVEVLRAGSVPPLLLIERRDVGPAR